MAQKGEKKHPEHVRREIARRYEEYRRNMPKRLMAEHDITSMTLHAYVSEFRQRA